MSLHHLLFCNVHNLLTLHDAFADCQLLQQSNQPNPKEKASRFRVPSQEEGKTAIRAYNNPSPSKGPTNASSTKWTVPAKYASGGGLAGQSLQSRADAYMKGVSSRCATDHHNAYFHPVISYGLRTISSISVLVMHDFFNT
jgi:hypothetical protein